MEPSGLAFGEPADRLRATQRASSTSRIGSALKILERFCQLLRAEPGLDLARRPRRLRRGSGPPLLEFSEAPAPGGIEFEFRHLHRRI
jgi:hypothetical protein